MDLSVVNHEDYFAKIGDDHKFPINKFGELASYLLKKKIVKKNQLLRVGKIDMKKKKSNIIIFQL